MKGQIRRVDRQTSEQDAISLLAYCEYGFLATSDGDSQPYITPLNFVLCDRAIYVHCANVGHKLDNIAKNSKVCFSVVGKTKVLKEQYTSQYESSIAFGIATVVSDKAESFSAMMALCNKYMPEMAEMSKSKTEATMGRFTVIKIDITSVTGKANAGE